MWTALIIFVALCLLSYLVVHNLYLKLEIKELKEKLSWYTQPVAPVPMVLAEQEDLDAE